MLRVRPVHTGRPMPSNTSGVAGVAFGYRCDVLHVFSAAGRERTNYSTAAHGERGAVRLALKFRRDRGLPVPSIATALEALRAWKERRS